jgi:hypothetical protein
VSTAIAYEATRHGIPNPAPGAFEQLRRGVAYERDGFFIHQGGLAEGLWAVMSGFTASERADGDLRPWAERHFGARDIVELDHSPGEVTVTVWRPGIYWQDQLWQALDTNRREQRAAEQSLHILIAALNDLFLYVEPDGAGLDAYGPKTRELLILACTEVENLWTTFLRRTNLTPGPRGFSTNDYVKLRNPLHLTEFRVNLVPYQAVPVLNPFGDWDATTPTQSLAWYDAYNKAKHDRAAHLQLATILRCIEAVAANIVLHCVRFGPFGLFEQRTPLAALANHLFTVDLVDPDPRSFYVPAIEMPPNPNPNYVVWQSQSSTLPWRQRPLAL